MAKRQFGASTHLYQAQRLCRDHLLEIAAHGFDTVEVFAIPSHVDYGNVAAVADLQEWLAEAGLELTSICARVTENEPAEAEQALYIARRIPLKVFVARVEGSRDSARRNVERLATLAAPLGVKIAIEVLLNEQAPPGSLVHFLEEDLEAEVGICLDFGRVHIGGDVVDAVETVAEHLTATHVHDNRGRHDDHLVPFEGTIDWPAALTAIQKVGYEGPLIFEIAAHGSPKETLKKAKKARERMERFLCVA